MTLSNDQCIAVAKKVWGWTNDGRYWFDCEGEMIWMPGRGSKLPVSWIYTGEGSTGEDEGPIVLRDVFVLSWQGFGRTVEAMAERKLNLEINRINGAWPERRVVFVMSTTEMVTTDGHEFTGWPQNLQDNNLIEATHLAALEAVKSKEKP